MGRMPVEKARRTPLCTKHQLAAVECNQQGWRRTVRYAHTASFHLFPFFGHVCQVPAFVCVLRVLLLESSDPVRIARLDYLADPLLEHPFHCRESSTPNLKYVRSRPTDPAPRGILPRIPAEGEDICSPRDDEDTWRSAHED